MAMDGNAEESYMRWLPMTMLFGLGTTLASLPGAAQDKSEIKLEVVKYDGLKDAVVRHRGKVLLIDFWGEY